MDILAHALWVGVGIAAAQSRRPVSRHTAAMTVALAIAPDLGHMLPILGWSISGEGSVAQLWAYAVALPNQEPALPPMIGLWSHHLHCALHSAIVAAAATLILWLILRRFWVPLLGWWSHIVIDIFTHSAEFYPAPVLYPITYRGFDGVAWNTPWFMLINYSALMICAIYFWRNSSRNDRL